VDEVLQEYKEKENPYIIDYVNRRIDYKFKPNQMYVDIAEELDYMISKRDVAIPAMFYISKDSKTLTWQLGYNRKHDKKNINK